MSRSKPLMEQYKPVELCAKTILAIRECRVMHPAFADVLDRALTHYEMGSPLRILLIMGASGTGKTTLRHEICRLINQKVENDESLIPAVSLSASPPEGSNFSFRVFYEQFLFELREPLVEYKLDPKHRLEQLEDRPNMKIHRSTAAARFMLEKILRRYPPAASLIDEAQHLGRNANLAKSIEHMDVVKSLSEVGSTKLMLFGTLQAQSLQHLNGQLSRRIKAIELKPYDASKKGIQDFWSTFKSICVHLKLPMDVDVTSAAYLRNASGGAIGILSEWLQEAAETAILDKDDTITLDHLKETQPAKETLDLIAGEVFSHEIGKSKRRDSLSRTVAAKSKKAAGRRPGKRKSKKRDEVGVTA